MTRKPLRLFFATWPPAGRAAELHAWARSVAAGTAERVLPAENLHLTLAFLGATPPERLRTAVEAARAVMFEPHTVRLDRAGHWARSAVVFAAPAETPPALQALATNLRSGLAAAGFVLEDRAFAPHVTLIRKAVAARDLRPLQPVEWPLAAFVLARSTLTENGSQYEILEEFAV